MPTLIFIPQNKTLEVNPNTKILAAAIKNKIPIRYGCAACQCGTCGVLLKSLDATSLSPMDGAEKALLDLMSQPLDGSIRLACKTKILEGSLQVDLTFQDRYDPDQRKS